MIMKVQIFRNFLLDHEAYSLDHFIIVLSTHNET